MYCHCIPVGGLAFLFFCLGVEPFVLELFETSNSAIMFDNLLPHAIDKPESEKMYQK